MIFMAYKKQMLVRILSPTVTRYRGLSTLEVAHYFKEFIWGVISSLREFQTVTDIINDMNFSDSLYDSLSRILLLIFLLICPEMINFLHTEFLMAQLIVVQTFSGWIGTNVKVTIVDCSQNITCCLLRIASHSHLREVESFKWCNDECITHACNELV